MHHVVFLRRVQEVGNMDSREAAERAVRATFETLAERVTQGATTHLAAQLPREIAQYLLRRGPRVQELSIDEFWNHVGHRERVEQADAIRHTKAVFQVLREAVSAGEMDHFAAELPPKLRAQLDVDRSAPRTAGGTEARA
ncbi:MAG TPA: DUF2267 domain-containing protein [Gemmatimonadaceae bacterium]|nr:DUF2267 domain-containing protein [Gemmatimonadaceae bacterium]